jgi:hypothetical protein
VFGGVWAVSTLVIGGVAAWDRRQSGGSDSGDHNGDGNDEDDPVEVVGGNRSGGDSGNSGRAFAIYEPATANEVLLKQDRVLFNQTRM